MIKEDFKFKKFTIKFNAFKDELLKKNIFINNSLSLFKTQIKLIDSIIKNLNTHSKFLSNIDNTKDKDYIYEIIKLITENIETMMTFDSQLIKELISNLTMLIDTKKKDNKKNNLEIEPIYNQLRDNKEKMERQKKLYFDIMTKTELFILDNIDNMLEKKKKLPIDNSLQNYEILKEPKNNYLNYRICVGNLNKSISELNNKEKYILDYFDDIDNNFNLVISNVLKKFYENQNIKNNYISNNINLIKDMIINNNDNIFKNKSKDNYLYLSKYSFDLIECEKFPSNINFLHIKDNNEFNKCVNTIEFLNETIGNVYPNFSKDKEKKRNKIRKKIDNLINHNNFKITEEDKNELLEILKTNEENQMLFINILNRLRIDGKYKINKEVNYLIGNALNVIFNSLFITKNYDIVKNSIILSQTFYYEDETKEKKYISELIKNNELLHNEDFWRNYIDLMITNEFMRYQNNLQDKNINIFMKNNIPVNISNKLDELLFAQLIPNIKIMVEFNVDKKIIIKIMNEFIHKYDYLNKDHINTLYNIISKNKEEIEKLKKKIRSEFILNLNKLDNIKEGEVNEDKKKISEIIQEDMKKSNIKSEKINGEQNEGINKIKEENEK